MYLCPFCKVAATSAQFVQCCSDVVTMGMRPGDHSEVFERLNSHFVEGDDRCHGLSLAKGQSGTCIIRGIFVPCIILVQAFDYRRYSAVWERIAAQVSIELGCLRGSHASRRTVLCSLLLPTRQCDGNDDKSRRRGKLASSITSGRFMFDVVTLVRPMQPVHTRLVAGRGKVARPCQCMGGAGAGSMNDLRSSMHHNVATGLSSGTEGPQVDLVVAILSFLMPYG